MPTMSPPRKTLETSREMPAASSRVTIPLAIVTLLDGLKDLLSDLSSDLPQVRIFGYLSSLEPGGELSRMVTD